MKINEYTYLLNNGMLSLIPTEKEKKMDIIKKFFSEEMKLMVVNDFQNDELTPSPDIVGYKMKKSFFSNNNTKRIDSIIAFQYIPEFEGDIKDVFSEKIFNLIWANEAYIITGYIKEKEEYDLIKLAELYGIGIIILNFEDISLSKVIKQNQSRNLNNHFYEMIKPNLCEINCQNLIINRPCLDSSNKIELIKFDDFKNLKDYYCLIDDKIIELESWKDWLEEIYKTIIINDYFVLHSILNKRPSDYLDRKEYLPLLYQYLWYEKTTISSPTNYIAISSKENDYRITIRETVAKNIGITIEMLTHFELENSIAFFPKKLINKKTSK